MLRKSTQPLASTIHNSPCMRAALATAVLAAAFSGNASADAYLDPIGGGGGGQFQAHCASSELLVGFELRAGDDVDAIRPLCVTAYGPRDVSAISFTVGTGLIRHFTDANREVFGNYSEISGDWSELTSGWYGGTGGGLTNVVCPKDQPIVIGMFVGAEGVDTVIVNNIHLFCGLAADTQVVSDFPAAVFDAPAYKASKSAFGFGVDGDPARLYSNTQRCPTGQVAVGVHGRSGKWLDSIGLICGVPRLAIKSIGRVNVPSTPGPQRPICDVARDARARNSPAAPNLEAQCRAVTPTVHSIGRVNVSSTPGPERPICDVARAARARNSPAAPNLEAQCAAAGGPASAAAPPAVPAAAPGLAAVAFAPPLFDDGAQLWACVDVADAEANGGGCPGLVAARAFCRLKGLSGSLAFNAVGLPDVLIAAARPEIPVRAMNNAACEAQDCQVISEIHCDP